MKSKTYKFVIEGEIKNFVEDNSDCLESTKIIKNCLKEGVDIGETFGMLLGEFETKISKFKFKRSEVKKDESKRTY